MPKLVLLPVLILAATIAASAGAQPPSRCTDNTAGASVRSHCFEAAGLGGSGEGRVRFEVSGSFRLRASTAVVALVDAPGSTLRVWGGADEMDFQAAPGLHTSAPPIGGKLLLARSLRIDGDCPTGCYLELVADRYAFSAAGSGEIDVVEARDSGAGIRSSLNERLLLGDRTGTSSGTTLVFYGDAPQTNCNFTNKPCEGTTGHGYLAYEQPHRGRVLQLGHQIALTTDNPADMKLWDVAFRWPFCGC